MIGTPATMRLFRDISIRRKLILLFLLVSGIGMGLMCAALLGHDLRVFRLQMVRDLERQADLIGYQARAALAFDDARDAERTLAGIALDPSLTMGIIYRANGTVLARQASAVEQPAAPAPAAAGSWIAESFAHVVRPITLDGDEVGRIYLRGHLRQIRERASAYAQIMAGLFLATMLLTAWLASKFARVLTAPIFHLVATADRVASARDYGIRATRKNRDELGALVDGFNSMIAQIQVRDTELQAARHELEQRVEDRTRALQVEMRDREAIQAQLRREEEFIRHVLDMVPSMIFVRDADGRIVFANRSTAVASVASVPMTGPTDGADSVVLSTGGDITIPEEKMVDSSGAERWMQTVRRLIQTPEGEAQVLVIATDITLVKKAEVEMRRAKEAAEAANRAKSAFLANMSHEIRTPMNGVIGMASLLLDTRLDEEQRSFASTIASCSGVLLRLLSDVLDISKIEAGKMTLERASFDLEQAVEETMDLLATRAFEKGIELSCLIENGVPRQVMGDSTRLRQLLLNLVGNAIKFTERGEVSVTVAALPSASGPARIRFAIHDTGIGISAESQSKLFQAFSQTDTSTTRRYGGTGLGLHISKQIVQLMGGEIGVQSAEGRGSTFWFVVELPSAGVPPRSEARFPGRHALVVLPRECHRRTVRHYLEGAGLACTEAGSAVETSILLDDLVQKGATLDLAVLDSHFAEAEPVLVHRLRALKPRTPHLILAASLGLGLKVIPDVSGQPHTITKPIRRQALLGALTRALAGVTVMVEPPAKPLAIPPAAPRAVERNGKRVRVLIAEDNLINQRLAERFVQKLGYHVEVVPNGAKAVAANEQHRYDIILMDCQMPELDGYEATRRIRAEEDRLETPVPARVRIIAMTANAVAGDRERCLEAGMDDYLTKPINITVLGDAIRRQLDQADQAQPTEPVPQIV